MTEQKWIVQRLRLLVLLQPGVTMRLALYQIIIIVITTLINILKISNIQKSCNSRKYCTKIWFQLKHSVFTYKGSSGIVQRAKANKIRYWSNFSVNVPKFNKKFVSQKRPIWDANYIRRTPAVNGVCLENEANRTERKHFWYVATIKK